MNREELSMSMFGKTYSQLAEHEKFEVNQELQQDVAKNRIKTVT